MEALRQRLLDTAHEAERQSRRAGTQQQSRVQLKALAERLRGDAKGLERMVDKSPPARSFRSELVGATLVLLMTLAVQPANAQSLPASTGCVGNNVVTVYRPDIAKDSLALSELEAHERVHRAQIRNGMEKKGMNCADALQALSSNPLVNLMAEVPAYRAQAEWNKRARADFDVVRFYEFVAQALYATYSPSGCRKDYGGGIICPQGKMPAIPYSYIYQYLTTGVRPPWPPQLADYPQPNVVLADSLLATGGIL
jgi:hypothetical protein